MQVPLHQDRISGVCPIGEWSKTNSGWCRGGNDISTTGERTPNIIGLCSYFWKYVENCAIIAKPLYELLKKNVPFMIGLEQIQVFEPLK